MGEKLSELCQFVLDDIDFTSDHVEWVSAWFPGRDEGIDGK